MLRGSTRLLLSGATIAIRPSPPRHAGALRALHRRANTLATRRLAPDPAAFGLAASRSDLLRAVLVSRLSPLSQLAQRYASTDRSKIEYTLQLLKEDAKREKEEADRKTALAPKAEDAAAVEKVGRMTRIWTAIKHELKHYWHGFRLLGYETRLSAKYLAKMSRGNALSRRERQQFVRTISDLLRMVPFSFFIIVPGAELLLPFYLKFFPSALPSTFQEASKEEEKLRKLVRVKIETAKLLQDTLEELALEKKKKASKSEDKATKESMAVEFAQFMKRVREEGSYVSNEELFRYSKLFEDELTLDSLAMSQLRALCKLLSIPTLGSPEILRFQLTMKLRELRTDDKQIALEGIDSLTTAELQSACRERGMRAMGVSEQRLREQLQQWLELSLNDRVPPSLLLLSRTLYMPDDVPFSTRLKQLVVSLPDGLAETTRQKLTEIEGGKLDYKARIALLKNIEEAIAHEKRVERDLKKAEAADEEKRKAAAAAAVEDEAKASAFAAESVAATKAAQTFTAAAASIAKKQAGLNKSDLADIEHALHGSAADEAKHDVNELKEQLKDHADEVQQAKLLGADESKVAKRLRDRLKTLIGSVDSLTARLEDEKRRVDETLADPAAPSQLEAKQARRVRIADLLEKLDRLRSEKDPAKLDRIEQLLTAIDKDMDGVVESSLIIEVIDMLERNDAVSLDAAQISKLVETLKREDLTEAIEHAIGEPIRTVSSLDNLSADKQPAASAAPESSEKTPAATSSAAAPKPADRKESGSNSSVASALPPSLNGTATPPPSSPKRGGDQPRL